MIYTVTLNPTMDYFLKTDMFEVNEMNKSTESYIIPGGKGIVCSQVLSNLQVPNVAFGFKGGFLGEILQTMLIKNGVKADLTSAQGLTRLNVKINNHGQETFISGSPPEATRDNFDLLMIKLVSSLSDGDILVIAGSTLPSLGSDIYQEIIKRAQEAARIKVFVDTTGKALLGALSMKPFVIKPNLEELSEIVGYKVETVDDIVTHGKDLLSKGAQNVIVSMGSKGATLVGNDGHIYFGKPLKGQQRSSNGAGDSMVAGFAKGISEGLSIKDAFAIGVAAGAATAFSDSYCTFSAVEALLKQVNIETIV